MAQVRIKSSGNSLNDSEIENIASEETLLNILTRLESIDNVLHDKPSGTTSSSEKTPPAKSMDAYFNKIKEKLGIPANKTDAGKVKKSAESQVNSIEKTTSALDTLGPMVAGISEAFAGMAVIETVTSAFHSIVNTAGLLVGTFISGKTSLSDFLSAIANGTANIPILGTLTSILSYGMTQIDSWNKSLYALNMVGASFNNSMVSMVVGAASAGMALQDYSSVITANAQGLAKFGTVMDGVRVFTGVANITMKEYVGQLTDMGISLADYQRELPGILSLFGASMKAHGASDQLLASSAMQLTSEFDAMAKLTGQSRDEQAKQLQALEVDAAWKLKMSQMSTTELANQNMALAEVNATMGPTSALLYKMHVLGIVPLTKDMQILQATVPGIGKSFDDISNKMKNGKYDPTDVDNRIGDMLESGIKSGAGFQEILNAVSSGLDDASAGSIAKIQGELLAHQDLYIKNGVFNKVLFDQKMKEIRDTQTAGEKIRESLASWSAEFMKLEAVFIDLVMGPLLKVITPTIDAIVKTLESADIQNRIKNIFEEISTALGNIVNWVIENGNTIEAMVLTFFNVIVSIIGVIVSVAQFIFNHLTLIKVLATIILSVFAIITVIALAMLAVSAYNLLAGGLIAAALTLIDLPLLAIVGIVIAVVAGLFLLVGAIWWVIDKLSSFVPGISSPGPAPTMTSLGGGSYTPSISGMIAAPQGAASQIGNPQTAGIDNQPAVNNDEQTEILSNILDQIKIGNNHNERTSRATTQIASQTA